jgi:predicted small lipoprotein YifL
MMRNKGIGRVLLAAVLVAGAAACEKKGPVEQAAEEIDEAVETVKDGKESTANKVDDAVDELRK